MNDYKDDPVTILRFHQWVSSNNYRTGRFYFYIPHDLKTDEPLSDKPVLLPQYTRHFLVKKDCIWNERCQFYNLGHLTRRIKIQPATERKRLANNEPLLQSDPIAQNIFDCEGYELNDKEEAGLQKISGLDPMQPLVYYNKGLKQAPFSVLKELINSLDTFTYLDRVEDTFYKNWYNLDSHPKTMAEIRKDEH